MVNDSNNNSFGAVPRTSHRCGLRCLGPLTFHPRAVGDAICLSEGGRLAERSAHTFKKGLVFSSRPVRLQERVRLRVEKETFRWHGALRVGFTTVPPSDRPLPLPCMAIPNLTNSRGHWAAPVDESCCQAGSELEFWVSHGGTVYVRGSSSMQHKLLEGVDLSQPLWAMIDTYGQTCSVYLLGSEKRELLHTRRSCPAPKRLTPPDFGSLAGSTPDIPSVFRSRSERVSLADTVASSDDACVVCLAREATIALPCGHRCLCDTCIPRVIQQFDTCPLCRHKITAPSLEAMSVSEGNARATSGGSHRNELQRDYNEDST